MATIITDITKEGTRYPETKWVKEIAKEEVLEKFTDFEEDAQWLIKLMPNPSLWAIHKA